MISAIGVAKVLIDENEGDVHTVYKCPADKWTIGRGRNLEDKGISQEESDYLLQNDLKEADRELSGNLSFYADLDEARRAVLIDMYHNLGLHGLLGFKKMLAAFRVKDYDEAARQIEDSRYWSQVGVRAKRNYVMVKYGRYYERDEAGHIYAGETGESIGI